MSSAAFDSKFGESLVPNAPNEPGVYRYIDRQGSVIYVGKAKNLRRRLASYRSATRKRVHRKMRTLVREAHTLVYEQCPSERAALLRESQLIRELKPIYNVDGAYSFLYPALGLGTWDKHTLLCFTTAPDSYASLNLTWFGCFRSRPRVKLAFSALATLLAFIAHREKSTRLPQVPRLKGSRFLGFRQLPAEVAQALPGFFSGKERLLPGLLSRRLLAKPGAVQDAARVEGELRALMAFYENDARRLSQAFMALGRPARFVPQAERDALFIQAAFADDLSDL